MKQLSVQEITTISGGCSSSNLPNDGYNFSYIVSNGLTVGLITGFLAGNISSGIFLGSSYATLMLVAKTADNYFFAQVKTIEPIEVVFA